MKPATTIIVALALGPVLAEASLVQNARYLMGTVCEVAVTGGSEGEIESAFVEAERIESMLSTWIDTSELSRVNRGTAQPSAELRKLLGMAMEWSERTGGAFDPRVGMLIDTWATRKDGQVPDRAAVDAALRDRDSVTPSLEEGAFGKGYAIDRMLAMIGAPEAMINFGGQVAVRGQVRVTVADPRDREKAVLEFTLTDGSVSTSSGSEKTFAIGDRRFSHIIDPRSGEALPPRGSVSVITDDALRADILSTALYVMGEEEGLRWADANGTAALFITPQNHIRMSAKARERVLELELLDPEFQLKD